MGPEVPKRLENTLIVQDASDGSLVVNFDKTLLNLFHEVRIHFVGQASVVEILSFLIGFQWEKRLGVLSCGPGSSPREPFLQTRVC